MGRIVAGSYRAIAYYVGLVLLLAGALALTPLLALVVWPEELPAAKPLLGTAALLLALGGAAWRWLRPDGEVSLTLQEGGVALVVAWWVVCSASAIPFLGFQGLGPIAALFEAVSAWTTTGLSVVDVTQAPHVILLWRSVMQLAGGAGMAIILLVTLGGPLGPGLAAAEGRSDQLVPHVRESARLVLILYACYAVAGIAGYIACGMGAFDAVNHAFAAVSTGGFSTRPESIGAWDSPAIEAVSLPLMILGSTNFQTAWLVLHRRWRAVGRNVEVRFTVVAAAVAIGLVLWQVAAVYPTLGKSARVAVFETLSALTTTGFSTVGYAEWPKLGLLVMLVLMVIGGHTGSTAGGLKQARAVLLLRSLGWELRRLVLPRGAVVVRDAWAGEARVRVSDPQVVATSSFLVLYLLALVAGVAVMTGYGFSLEDSLFEMESSLGTVGLSVGVTGPATPAPVLLVQIAAMLLGRLEFFVVLAAFLKVARDVGASRRGR
ncbi:MAG: potassium transporter [Myxococcales bacterium]